MMNRPLLPWMSCGLLFLLAVLVLFPRLCPWDDTLPARDLVEGETSYARQEWMDGLAFETILDASLERFGKPQLHNLYIGGGYLISGDPRDGTVNPLTWALIGLDGLARMKAKMILALAAAFFSVIVLARRVFRCGWAAGGAAGLTALILLRFWPSMIENPLDAGLLFALPAAVILWTHRGRLMNVGIAGLFLTLAIMQTGAGWIALVLAFLLIGLCRGLIHQEDTSPHPIRDSVIALCFCLMFGAVKFLPMAEAAPSIRAFWAHPVDPVLRMSSFVNEPLLPLPFTVLAALTALSMVFWLSTPSSGKTGAFGTVVFALLCFVPDWGVYTGGLSFGPSEMPGPIDSPARFFYPFFVLFAAASTGGAVARFSREITTHWAAVLAALAGLAMLIGISAAQMTTLKWTPPDPPYDFSRFQNPLKPAFFQVQVPREKKQDPFPDSLHPALLAPEKIGVTNSKILYDWRSRTVPKVHFRGRNQTAVKVHRYRNEFYTTSKRLEYVHVEDWGNRIEIQGKAMRPGYFVLNRNFDEGWRLEGGQLVRHRGQLAIDVKKPGEYSFVLRYVPFSLYFGLCISLLTLIAYLSCIVPRKKAIPGNPSGAASDQI